jgi:hypothetical protein
VGRAAVSWTADEREQRRGSPRSGATAWTCVGGGDPRGGRARERAPQPQCPPRYEYEHIPLAYVSTRFTGLSGQLRRAARRWRATAWPRPVPGLLKRLPISSTGRLAACACLWRWRTGPLKNLHQALEVAELERERARHHGVRGVTECRGGRRLALCAHPGDLRGVGPPASRACLCLLRRSPVAQPNGNRSCPLEAPRQLQRARRWNETVWT